MTQDERIATIANRMATAASNLRFARTLAEHKRILRDREVTQLSDLALEVLRELGALVQELDLGVLPADEDESCP